MKRWHIGINSYHRHASYTFEEAPWYIFTLENVVQLVCEFLTNTPVLNWDSPFGENNWSIATLYHCYIDMPVFGFCGDRIKALSYPIEYDEVREKHPDMCTFMDEQEKEVAEWDDDDVAEV